MVVLPYYLHNYKAFGKITILGEFLAISAVTMCMLFIFVDMGQPHADPERAALSDAEFHDVLGHGRPCGGYLVLNAVIACVTLSAERKGVAPPAWIRPIIILSIPWAVSIHTVTAFLYSGLPGRSFWLTAILAPRFLASAFAAGPALLILLCLVVRRLTKFDAGREAIQKLALIVTYAMIVNVFFVLMEVFTVFYSQIPEHMEHFAFLFVGLDGQAASGALDVDSRSLWRSSLGAPDRARHAEERDSPGRDLRDGLPLALDRQGPRPHRRRVHPLAARSRHRATCPRSRNCQSPSASGPSGSS